MAGLAALMTRKKRQRRQLEMRMNDPSLAAELTGKEAEEFRKAQTAQETIKKMLIGKELLHQKSKQSFDALSQVSYQDNDDDPRKDERDAYSAIYIGLVLICIGVVITFVGLGEKGFKTVELKLIGPILCCIGLTAIILKTIQCSFPSLFQYPNFLRRRKLGDKEQSSLMEKGSKPSSVKKLNCNGESNGGSSKSSPNQPPADLPTPRVTLQSAKRLERPKSTIPNYIEPSSDDEDDFNPSSQGWRKSVKVVPETPSSLPPKKSPTPPAILPLSQSRQSMLSGEENRDKGQGQNGQNPGQGKSKDEVILNPKGLML